VSKIIQISSITNQSFPLVLNRLSPEELL